MDRRQHWNTVFTTKSEQDLSWFEALPDTSLHLLESSGLNPETCVLDVGGGDSHLKDALAARGPTTISLRNCTPLSFMAATTEGRSLTDRTSRFHPPGSCS